MIQKHKYLTLDAIRGVAAIFVVILHIGESGGIIYFPRSYLAVDLFFVLSGFVISVAYDDNLASSKLSVSDFLKIRTIRLYPLYFLALVISILGHFYVAMHDATTNWTDFIIEVLLGFILIPSPVPGNNLFPLNSPSWSIFFEMIVNGLYAKFRSFLSNQTVALVMCVSAILLLAISELLSHSLNFGWGWGNGFGGLVRAIYSFAAGILIFRHRKKVPLKNQFNSLMTLPILLIIGLLLGAQDTQRIVLYDLIVVLLVFPTLVLFASYVEPTRNGILGKVYAVLGLTSYAIYILQTPFIGIYHNIILKHGHWFILHGLIAILLLFTFSLLLDMYYDQPVRRWLRKKYLAVPTRDHRNLY